MNTKTVDATILTRLEKCIPKFRSWIRAAAYYCVQMLPNDDKEQERLDILHHVFRLTLGDEYPSAEIIGTDLSPIQPRWVPPNVRFQVDDATEEWAFPPESFDFIHARCLAGSVRD